jgi:hypothetical protein
MMEVKKRGVAIFAKACFGHPSPSKRQKLNATANAFGAPIRPRHLVPTQQWVGTLAPNDLTPCRMAFFLFNSIGCCVNLAFFEPRNFSNN